MRTNTFYKVTDSREAGKVVIRFANSRQAKEVKSFLYEERYIPSCYLLHEVEEGSTEAESFCYKEMKLSAVSSFIERHYAESNSKRKAEAKQQEREAEAEARKAEAEEADKAYYFGSLSSYMKEAKTAEAIYTPIDKFLTACAKTFYSKTVFAAYRHGQQAKQTGTTKEGVKVYEGGSTDSTYNRYYNDYMKLSASGKLIRTENYDSYRNAVYAELLTMHRQAETQNSTFDDVCIWYTFNEALKKATNKGLYRNYHSLHGKLRKATIAEAEAEAMEAKAEAKKHKLYMAESVIFDSFPVNRQETLLHYMDKYNTEAEAMKHVRIAEAMEAMTDRQSKAVKLFALGYSYKNIASYMECTEEAVKQLIKFARNRAYLNEVDSRQNKAHSALIKRIVESGNRRQVIAKAEAKQA